MFFAILPINNTYRHEFRLVEYFMINSKLHISTNTDHNFYHVSSWFENTLSFFSVDDNNCRFHRIWLQRTHFSSLVTRKISIARLLLFSNEQKATLINLPCSDPIRLHKGILWSTIWLLLNYFANSCAVCLGFSSTMFCRS